MRYSDFCKKFYNDGKKGVLGSVKSKAGIARFFLENALLPCHAGLLPSISAMSKWFTTNREPEVTLWTNVKEDFEELRFSSAVYAALDKTKLQETMRECEFKPTTVTSDEQKQEFSRAITRQFQAFIVGKGNANNVMAIKHIETKTPPVQGDVYYKPYFDAISDRLNRVNTIFREISLQFDDCYVPTGLLRSYPFYESDEELFVPQYVIEKPDIWSIRKYANKLIVQAIGGMGKSMLMRYLMFDAIRNFSRFGLIPVFVKLSDYRTTDCTMKEFLFSEIQWYFPELSRERFEEDYIAENFILLLDGMDEIPSSCHQHFVQELHRFCAIHRCTQVILSTRPLPSEADLGSFKVLCLSPLTKANALMMVDKMIAVSELKDRLIRFRRELEKNLYRTHHVFAKNPLLLTFMMFTYEIVGALPKQRHRFYEEVYYVLAKRHDLTKDTDLNRFKSGLDAERLFDLFAAFCAISYQEQLLAFSYNDLYRLLKSILESLDKEEERNISPADLIEDFTNGVNMLFKEGEIYYFYHRSFQEYFCAVSFSKQLNTDLIQVGKYLDERGHYSDDLVLPMLADIIPGDVEQFITLPFLKRLFDYAEWDHQKNGWSTYRSYLWSYYTDIEVEYGLEQENVENWAMSYMHSFVINYYGIRGDLSIVEFPYDRNMVHAILRYEKDSNGDLVFREISKGDPEFNPPESPHAKDVDFYEVYLMSIQMPDIISSAYKYDEMLNLLEEETFPLKKEFIALENLYHRLEEKYSRPVLDKKYRIQIRRI